MGIVVALVAVLAGLGLTVAPSQAEVAPTQRASSASSPAFYLASEPPPPRKPTDTCDALKNANARRLCRFGVGVTLGTLATGRVSTGTAVGLWTAFEPSNPLEVFAKAVAEAGSVYLLKVGDLVTRSTRFDPTAPWFLRRYAVAFAVAVFLMAFMLIWTLARAARPGADPMAALSAALKDLPLAFALCMFTPAAAQFVSAFVDQVTDVLMAGERDDAVQFLQKTVAQVSRLTPDRVTGGVGSILAFGLVSCLAAGVLLLEMAMRQGGLYIGAALAPFVFAGVVNRRMWPAIRKPVTAWGILLASKPVITLILGLVFAAGGGLGEAPGAAGAGASSLIFVVTAAVLATLAIPVMWQFVPQLGDAAFDGGRASRREVLSHVPGAHSAGYVMSGIARDRILSMAGGGAASQRSASASGGGPGRGGSARGGRTGQEKASAHRQGNSGAGGGGRTTRAPGGSRAYQPGGSRSTVSTGAGRGSAAAARTAGAAAGPAGAAAGALQGEAAAIRNRLRSSGGSPPGRPGQ